MGNHVSSPKNDTVKLILFDGTVHELAPPLTAAELMLEHPQQVVVELDAAKKSTPLPADKNLESEKVYLMLPMRRGKPAALTPEQSRRLILIADKVLRRSRGLVCCSGFVQVCQLAAVATEDRFVMTQKKREAAETVAVAAAAEEEERSLPEILPEYLSKQVSGKGWRPSLDTIKEKKIDTKVSHWLF